MFMYWSALFRFVGDIYCVMKLNLCGYLEGRKLFVYVGYDILYKKNSL